jgi:hypothetical protein
MLILQGFSPVYRKRVFLKLQFVHFPTKLFIKTTALPMDALFASSVSTSALLCPEAAVIRSAARPSALAVPLP